MYGEQIRAQTLQVLAGLGIEHGAVEIQDVLEDNVRRFATELETHLLEVPRCCLDDQLADLG